MARPSTSPVPGRPIRRASARPSTSPVISRGPRRGPRSGRKRGVRGGVPEGGQGQAEVPAAARTERRGGATGAVEPRGDILGRPARYERGAHGGEPRHRTDRWDPALPRRDLERDGGPAVYRARDGEPRRGYSRGAGRDPKVSGNHGGVLWRADTLLDGGRRARGDRAWGARVHGQDRLGGRGRGARQQDQSPHGLPL